MRLYIRHANKEYPNGHSEIFKHDPGITETGKHKAKKLANILINLYGIPDLIICSPYKRTRETAMIMIKQINLHKSNQYKNIDIDNNKFKPLEIRSLTNENKIIIDNVDLNITNEKSINIPIKCDVTISEYLGNRINETLDVTEDTFRFKPPHPERFRDMQNRLYVHNNIMKVFDNSKKNVWFITHGIIITNIAKIMGFNIKRIPILGCVQLETEETNEVMCKLITLKNNMYKSKYKPTRDHKRQVKPKKYTPCRIKYSNKKDRNNNFHTSYPQYMLKYDLHKFNKPKSSYYNSN